MEARRFAVVWMLLAAASAGSWAEDESASLASANAGAAAVGTAGVAVSRSALAIRGIDPWIHRSMPDPVRSKLESAFALAVERVRDVDTCGDLFRRLGADGVATLRTGLYFPVGSHLREVEICGRNRDANARGYGALAYTMVGGAPTFICRHFERMPLDDAAVAVIHEALHHAGLDEWPHDRGAMTSEEITDMVREACGF